MTTLKIKCLFEIHVSSTILPTTFYFISNESNIALLNLLISLLWSLRQRARLDFKKNHVHFFSWWKSTIHMLASSYYPHVFFVNLQLWWTSETNSHKLTEIWVLYVIGNCTDSRGCIYTRTIHLTIGTLLDACILQIACLRRRTKYSHTRSTHTPFY